MFVHDASDADLGLRTGVVTLVDVRPSGHDVGIRLTTGTPTGSVVRPGRFAVHLAAGEDHDCWRAATTAPSDPTTVWPRLASSVEFGDGGRSPVHPGVDDR